MKQYFGLILLGVFLCLAGCAQKEYTGLACPQIGVLYGFNDVNHSAYKGELGDFSGKCIFKNDQVMVKGQIEVLFKHAELKEASYQVPVFFALVNPQGEILEKMVENLSLQFENDSQFAALEENFQFTFHTQEDMRAENYEILIGFQK